MALNFCPTCGAELQFKEAEICPKCGVRIRGPPKPEMDRYAGFWIRFGAYLIDLIILLIIAFGVGFFLGIFLAASSYGYSSYPNTSGFLVVFYLLFIPILWLYFAVQESSPSQATIGKRAVNIKVTDSEGNRIGFGKATLRTFIKFFPIVGFFGMLAIGFSENKQGLHDWAANTLVVYSN